MSTLTISNVCAGCVSAVGAAWELASRVEVRPARHPRSRWPGVAALLSALGCLSVLAAGPAMAQAGSDAEWTMPAKDYASTRFSGLAEITPANATRLRPVWTFSTGVLAGHQGQPLVVKNTMYVVTPWPNVLYAFDLTKEGYPLKWKYRPDVSPNCDRDSLLRRDQSGRLLRGRQDHLQPARRAHGRSRCGVGQGDLEHPDRRSRRGRNHADGALRREGPGHRRCLGRRVRHLRLGQRARSQDRQGGLDRRATSGPDAEVLAKPGTFKPFYDKGADLGQVDLAGKTPGRPAAPRCGAGCPMIPSWTWCTTAWATRRPRTPSSAPGDNKWTGSVLARRPADGSLVWAYQFTPHDNWDYDAVSTMILADLKIGGRARKALVTFNKNGFQYTLDRATGEVLAAEPFVQVTWAKRIDLKTGRPVLDSTKLTGASKGNVKDVCPSLEGGVSPASPAAYSPQTGLFYTSTNNICMDFGASPSAAHSRDALHRRRHAVSRRARRPSRRVHGMGCDHRARRSGRTRSTFRSGAARWSPPETWRSTGRSTAGSRRWMRGPASSSGSSRSAPGSWATRSPTAARTANNTSRSTPASVATGSCSPGTPLRRSRGRAPAGRPLQGHRPVHQPGRHRLDLRALTERKKPCQQPDMSSRWSRPRRCRGCLQERARAGHGPGARGRGPASEDRIPAGGLATGRRTPSVPRDPPSSTRTPAAPCSVR